MRSRDSELPRRAEDHNLLVSVRGDGEELRDVVCKLWLPRRVNERPVMFLYRTTCVSVGTSTDAGDYFQFFRGNISMPPSHQDATTSVLRSISLTLASPPERLCHVHRQRPASARPSCPRAHGRA
ncbi:MAG TPA: hypothetical protein VII75_13185 [Thermoanaerobaculia bacterium]